MNILQVTHSLSPRVGGPVEHIKKVSGVLRDKGHTTDIVSMDDPGREWIEDIPARTYPMGPSLTSYGFNHKYIPWLRENVSRYDAVVVRGLWQFPGYGTYLSLKGSDIPYFVFCHGMLDPWFNRAYPLKAMKKNIYWSLCERHVLESACCVLFTTQREERLAKSSFSPFNARTDVVDYGTSEPPVLHRRDKMDLFSKYPDLNGTRFILFLGRLHPKKGCDILIKAFADIFSSDRSIRLVMAGPGDKDYIDELVSIAETLGVGDRLSWPGMITGRMKWAAYEAASLFVLPSHQENFGIAVAEALGAGIPVMISDKVNICDDLKNSGAGIVVSDDMAGIKKGLLSWSKMPEESLDKMSGAGRALFSEKYHIEKAASSLLNTIERYSGTK